MARFLSRDSYNGNPADPLSQNHYLYASGNPVIYVDPSGHFFVSGLIAFSLGVIADLNIGYTINLGSESARQTKWWQIGFIGVSGAVVDHYAPGYSECNKFIDKLPYLTQEDIKYFKKNTLAVRFSTGISTLMEPMQGGVAVFVQEMAYLIIAKSAATQNNINFIMGKY